MSGIFPPFSLHFYRFCCAHVECLVVPPVVAVLVRTFSAHHLEQLRLLFSRGKNLVGIRNIFVLLCLRLRSCYLAPLFVRFALRRLVQAEDKERGLHRPHGLSAGRVLHQGLPVRGPLGAVSRRQQAHALPHCQVRKIQHLILGQFYDTVLQQYEYFEYRYVLDYGPQGGGVDPLSVLLHRHHEHLQRENCFFLEKIVSN